jgi:hypothetical protein
MAASARRALLIGIGPYPALPPLQGCVNDVRLMRAVLRDTFGFADDHCIQLENEQATRVGILSAFEQLIASTQHDDIVVIHYAGHGGQMTDREFDEPFGLDSTLQPWDTEGHRGDNRDITDDEIGILLERLGEKTQYITLIVDACHSGTITRDGSGPAARGTPADRRPVEELPPSPIPLALRRGPAPSGPSGWMPVTEKYVLISGCRDDELSYECFPPEGKGKITHGALTYFLAQALQTATVGTTYRDVFERVASQVNATNALQHPQMEGKADREIFGVKEFTPARYLRVVARDGPTLTLGAGLAQGVTVGSRYALHAAGSKSADEATRLGSVEITGVQVVTADARILDEASPDTIDVTSRAFETQHAFGEFRLTVVLTVTDDPSWSTLRDELEQSTLLDVTEHASAAAITVLRLPARDEVRPTDPVPRAGAIPAPMWAVLSESGHLLMPLKPMGEERVVRENLELIARYRQALALENPNPDSALRGQFSLDLLRRTAGGEWIVAEPETAGGQVVYVEGDTIGFRIVSAHTTPVFFSLIDFEINGAVTPLRPSARSGTSQQLLSEKQRVDIGPEMKTAPTVTWPAGFPYVERAGYEQEDEAIETVKLFLTQQPADFSVLAQGRVRDSTRRSPLGELLHSAMHGRPVRGVAMEPEREDDWTTVQRSFVIRRRTSVPLPATGTPVAVGDATITASGLTGTAEAFLGGPGRRQADAQLTAPLHDALAGAGIAVRRTVAITNAREVGGASRGDDTIAFTVPAPPAGHGQLVMATDELGVVSWHMAESATRPGSRGDVGARADTRRYHVPRGVPETVPAPGSRGVVALLGKKLLKELVYPLVDPIIGEVSATFVNRLEKAKWPYRVRTFAPGAHAMADVDAMNDAEWARLAGGRALLFVHGTFSRSHLAFGQLPAEVLQTLHERYGGRVFAFDHFTLSHDPVENVRQFFAALPPGLALDVDIVAHSRGGLVARVLSEEGATLARDGRRIAVGQSICVGSPHLGTALADPQRIGMLLDLITNIVNVVPSGGVTDVLGMVLGVLKQVAMGAMQGLDGLMAMDPDGEFLTARQARESTSGTITRAIAANVTPTDPGLARFLLSRGVGQFLGGTHDLVVPTASCFGALGDATASTSDRLLLEGSESVSHTQYFADSAVQQQLLAWLHPT